MTINTIILTNIMIDTMVTFLWSHDLIKWLWKMTKIKIMIMIWNTIIQLLIRGKYTLNDNVDPTNDIINSNSNNINDEDSNGN